METLIEILQNIKIENKSKTALQIKEGDKYFRVTYGELQDSALNIGLALEKIGISKGDRIGLITENSPYWGIAFFGILSSGATVVPIDNKLKDHSILNIIDHSQCKAVFTSIKFKDLMTEVSNKSKAKPQLILIDGVIENNVSMAEMMHPSKAPLEKIFKRPQPQDLCIILYTSGTTGSPKGVMLSHRNIASNVEYVTSVFPFSQDDRFISVLPLCHTYAITGDFLIPLYTGAQITYVENLKGPVLIERMQENKSTVFVAVPALIQLLYHQLMSKIKSLPPGKQRLFNALRWISKTSLKLGFPLGRTLFKSIREKLSPELKFFISGGAPIDPRIIEEFFYLGIPIYQGYGLTETSPILTVNTPKKNRIGSVGEPIPKVEIKLENGEILARGPNIMQGYFNNPQSSAEVLKGGWFYTGDLGHFDSQGFLYISGRAKNVIVTRGGKNVYPEELEEELARSPWIKEGCIVGLKKESKGFMGDELVYAILVPNLETFKSLGIDPANPRKNDPNIESKLSEEIKKTNERLADYKRIRGFELWDELPKTTTLKIKRKEILDALRQRGAQPVGGEIGT